MLEKKEVQLGEDIKKRGWREKEKEAGSAWRFPPVCPPSTVKLARPSLATESSSSEERQSNSNRVEKSNR